MSAPKDFGFSHEPFASTDQWTSLGAVPGGWMHTTWTVDGGVAKAFVPDDGLTGRRVEVTHDGVVRKAYVTRVDVHEIGYIALLRFDNGLFGSAEVRCLVPLGAFGGEG